jgi:hypothetical protein
MGVPNSEVGYTLATTGRGGHEVYKGHVVALDLTVIILYYGVRNAWLHRSAGYVCRAHINIAIPEQYDFI